MKKILILLLLFVCAFSCIKKKALKYDPELVGTWVCRDENEGDFWIIVYADGKATYRPLARGEDRRLSGDIRYSVFELKMWIGNNKFKVREWLSADMKGVSEYDALDYETLKLTRFNVDRRMTLKTSFANDSHYLTFFRISQ